MGVGIIDQHRQFWRKVSNYLVSKTSTLPFSRRSTTSSGSRTRGTPRKTFCCDRCGRVPVNTPQTWCLARSVAISILFLRREFQKNASHIFCAPSTSQTYPFWFETRTWILRSTSESEDILVTEKRDAPSLCYRQCRHRTVTPTLRAPGALLTLPSTTILWFVLILLKASRSLMV